MSFERILGSESPVRSPSVRERLNAAVLLLPTPRSCQRRACTGLPLSMQGGRSGRAAVKPATVVVVPATWQERDDRPRRVGAPGEIGAGQADAKRAVSWRAS